MPRRRSADRSTANSCGFDIQCEHAIHFFADFFSGTLAYGGVTV